MRCKMTLKLLEGDQAFFGPGPLRLAELIDGGMSLRQAAIEMGMAYSKAWRVIRDVEAALGFPLIERRRGGPGGGGSALTGEGRRLMENYRRFEETMRGQCDRCFALYFSDFLKPRRRRRSAARR